LDGKKSQNMPVSKHASLTQQNGFGPEFLHMMLLRLTKKGTTKKPNTFILVQFIHSTK
jgi:hypothetical protein